MKKPKIFFNPIGGSSILSITWFPGPLGNAVEANNGIGVGFFGHNGDLLSVQFDDVEEKKDHQVLKFDRYQVEVSVTEGKFLTHSSPLKLLRKKHAHRRKELKTQLSKGFMSKKKKEESQGEIIDELRKVRAQVGRKFKSNPKQFFADSQKLMKKLGIRYSHA